MSLLRLGGGRRGGRGGAVLGVVVGALRGWVAAVVEGQGR